MRQLTLDEMIDRYEAPCRSRAGAMSICVNSFRRQPAPNTGRRWWSCCAFEWSMLSKKIHPKGLSSVCVSSRARVAQQRTSFGTGVRRISIAATLWTIGQPIEYQKRWDIDTSRWKLLAGPDTGGALSSRSSSLRSSSKRSVSDIALAAERSLGRFESSAYWAGVPWPKSTWLSNWISPKERWF